MKNKYSICNFWKKYFNRYLKQLKSTYNRPQVLSRLNTDVDMTNPESKKNTYYEMYALYQNNIDYWSVEYLMKKLQPKILKNLTTYWWPKFCIRMSTFQEYVKHRYPLYYKLCVSNHLDFKRNFNDLNAENIEKSLSYRLHCCADRSAVAAEVRSTDKLLKKRKQVKIIADKTLSYKEEKEQSKAEAKSKERRNVYLKDLTDYALNDYQTSPPVGWKRPPSRATRLFQMLIDKNEEKDPHRQPVEKRDVKEIYLEAIYREDVAGQIFMKYLSNRNKTVRNSFRVSNWKQIYFILI